MKFARFAYWAAAIYGVAVTLPLYFIEQNLATQYPPPLVHAEYYYSFAGVLLVWQFLFVMIAIKPERLRLIMPLCVIEKLSLVPTFVILYPQDRFPQFWIPLLVIDLMFAVLFVIAFFKTRPSEAVSSPE
jgi:hypothetical protein